MSRAQRSLITAAAVVIAFVAATAYAAVTPIPPDRYPAGCHPNGSALQGGKGPNDLTGTPQRDLLRGGADGDGLLGYEKSDCLFGQRDVDQIDGRRGEDWIRGGKGGDFLDGGGGDDLIQGGRGDDFHIQGLDGRDTIHGGPGSERRKFGVRYIPGIEAGLGRDRVVDTKGHNIINCGRGIDTVVTNQKSEVENCEHVTRR
jgi:Ca2+-binding RTX toxin-like protein